MEKNNLAIATSNADLVIGDCLDALDALSADILGEDEEFVFDLEAAEVTTKGASVEELLTGLAEGKAAVVSQKCTCVYQLRLALSCGWVHLPQIQLL